MLINIHDSHLEKVGFLDSESPGAPGFFNDVEHHYLPEGASTFTFSVNKKKNGILQDYCQFLNEDAYFSFSENGEDHFYSVGTVDEDNDTTFTVTCYSLNLELRLEQCDPLENTASHNIQWYFDQMELINNTQITIGINEVSDLSRVIKYDGQESKLARLISLIGNFDAEFEFITKSNNDGTLDKIILNIYKQNDGVNFQGVGTNRDDVILTLDTNITGVSRTVDKTQIFNATTITGADGLTWNSSEFSYVNSDGVEEFYKRKNADTAFAPLSLAKYPSQIQSSTGDRWIRKNFTTDYTSANAIWGYAVSQFKKFAYGIVTYKVSVSSLLVSSEVGNGLPLKIGDTVTISDDNFIDSNGVHGLILSARVSEMEISRTDPTKNTLVFSNYIRLQSQISNDLQSQLSNLVDAATPFRAELSTTNGTQFKNGTGSTTLSAHIFKGSATTETVADSYEWSKDGTVVANAQTITVDASGVVDKAVYSFKATVGGKVVASQSVTITNVNDGTNGRSVTNVSQKWRLTTTTATPTQAWSDAGWLTTQPTTTATNKYLWSITRTTFNLAPLTQDVIEQKAVYGDKGDKGDTGNDGIAGKDGVGIKTTVITYAISTNETTAPATGWTSSVPSLVKGQYLWTKTVWNYSDGTSESGYTVTYIAKDGNNGNDGIAGKDGVGLINTTLRYAKSKDGVNKPEGRIVASFTDKFIPARSIIDNLIMTGKQVHLEQGKTYILSAETNGIFTNVHNVEQSNNATIWIVNPSFSTWDIISDTNTAIGTKYTHNRPTGDYEIRINSYEIDNSIWVKNIVFEDGTWTPDIPVANPGEYLWTRTTWFYSDNTNETGFSVAKMGEQGPKGDPGKDGIAGKDGVGIKTTVITYAISTNETTAPATGWTSSVPSLVKGQYLWTKTVWNYSDGTSESGYTVTYIAKDGNNGNDGIAGKDGVGLINTTLRYAKSKDGVNKPEGRIVASFTDKFIPARSIIDNLIMTGKQVHLEQGKTYILSAETNGIFTNVHNVEQSNNATIWIVNPSFSTWDIISDTNTAIGTKYTHNRPTGDYEIRINSYEIDNSIWVKNIVFEDGTWTPDIPVANPGEYLWTRTTWFYSDNTNETGFSVAKMGEQGPKGDPGKDGIAGKDGVGIKTTVITYAISTNETTAPATGWTSSVPSLVKGQYLWTKTVWTYTDNSSETGYSVTYISKDGNNGTNGIAGKDGVGIKTTTITYAGSTNGTTAPNTGWTSTVPTVAAGNYLWTKTVWAYTDNTSETGYSVAMMGVKGERGKQIFKSSYESVPHNNFHYWSDLSPAPSIDNPPKIGDTVITPSGNILQIDTVNVGGGGGGGTFGVGDVLGNIKGPSGSNGDPGKVVSDTEPTTRFKGLTWKYSGTTDLTASDGTVIKPNVEYYYNGTHWVINYFSVNNFAAESITSDKIDGKNLTITDGEFISKTTNGPVTTSTEIKDNHISISKTDGTVNTRNDIALDSEQGLAQKFTNINTGFYRTAGINYQGPFTSDSDGNFAQLTPQGTKLSTDVPWTKLSLMNNFNGNIEYAIINGTVYISASGVGVPAMTAGQWKQAAQLPTGSSAIPIRANRIAAGDSGDGLSWALLSNQAGGIFIRCSGNKSPTANLFNATLPYPIG
ncbi:hypothetical protein QT355_04810 [Lactococcus lactis]|uniref:hypothetical protein n=1 Tax=Lactococcus lactis TaxID=1358 RepID=UPI0028751AA8|nr:hypothetical protein [Lactococcus lactis]MDS1012631.1 hypothetical protein [Lactococcus lactis]